MQEVSRAIRGANPARPEFIGLIKSHTNEISNVPELCKTIGMPIIVFKNGNCNLYSMKVAFMEALRLRYNGNPDIWLCYLEPVARLSVESRDALNARLEIETKA
ncbi:MAG: hypothetical protein HQ579_00020 [Candidatus Omnitrophica bacterium]|nr:hypothetical protein [Candidatus Omnitrophota bacterium]